MLTPMQSAGGVQPQMGGGAAGYGQQAGMQQKKADGKLVKGDLDSTLASLAQNLNIGKGQEALKK